MRKNFAAIFTTSGIIIILTMFMNIISNVEYQLKIEHDTHVISAFDG